MTALRQIRTMLMDELMSLADDRRAHRRRMIAAFAAAGVGQLARVVAIAARAFGDAEPPGAWWATFVLALVALVLGAHELHGLRAIERRMGVLGKTIARMV